MKAPGSPDRAIELRRLLVDAREVCRALQLDEAWRSQGHGGLFIRCPWHAERTPSCSVRTAADGTLGVHCFGCGAGGDVLDLVAVAYGLTARSDFAEVLRRAAELAGAPVEGRAAASPAPRPAPPPHAGWPPQGEVAALWSASRCVTDAPEVASWLRSRALDPDRVAELELARALTSATSAPSWATHRRRSWSELGYCCLIPMFDEHGLLRSVRARRIFPGDGPKNLFPGGFRAAGLVMADSLARAILSAAGAPFAVRELRVVVAEGEPDFLTWATAFSDADAAAPAVLGVGSGSWNWRLASRIPSRARIVIRTHHDEAGEAYASAIWATLRDRCSVLRGGADTCNLCQRSSWTFGAAS